MMIKESIQEEEITIINLHAPNTGAPQYIMQMLTAIKEEIDYNTVIVGDFNTSFIPMDKSPSHIFIKETQALNDTIDQIDLIGIYRTFHPKTADYTFFSSAPGTFPGIDHILVHKSASVNFRKLNSYQHLF